MTITSSPSSKPCTRLDVKNHLDIAGISKSFGRGAAAKLVLSNVSLAVSSGEFVCLLGPSGCGKSTLLNTIAGFISPDNGIISINSKPVRGPGPKLGFVFQKNSLLPWMTLEQNVGYGLRLQGVGQAQRQARVHDYLEMVGLSRYKQAYPHQLSGGMQQRGSIIRALITNPSVLLMDEPFASLDAQTRSVLQEILLGIWRSLSTTVIFVTHDIDEAILLADRIVLMGVHPGHIKNIVPVHLPRPRTPETTFSDDYLHIRKAVLTSIREETSKLMEI